MKEKPEFHLTRRALLDLREIHDRSRKEWGEKVADRYLSDLYSAIEAAAREPDSGLLRQRRSAPFLMVPARNHFIVFDRIPQGIVVLTILHKVRNIEGLIEGLTPAFLKEVKRLKAEEPFQGS
jgi:plasmid stabilization system protein ParE